MRILGIVLGVLGAVLLLYFMFVFDISVASGIGTGRIINMGLMSDRSNGMIFGSVLFLGGLILLGTTKPSPKVAVAPSIPTPPQPPTGFNQPLPQALQYKAVNPVQTPQSFVMWRKTVPNVQLYSQNQLEWGYELGLEPATQFPQWVHFVESSRDHQRVVAAVTRQAKIGNLLP